MHDDVQVARVIEMTRALSHGQFPVRIVGDLGYGYGYPIFNFYGPLPYYVGGAFNLLKVDALTATKIMIGIGVLAGSISMYVLSSAIFGTLGGIFSTILFTYFPYRAVQIYVRGSIGELWAISFFPLLFYALFRITRKGGKFGVLIGILSLSAVILSHTVFGYIATGSIVFVAVAVCIISYVRNSKKLRTVGLSFLTVCILSLGITAFFWLPALTEMSYTNVYKVIGTSADYRDHFICLPQLWDSLWGFGGSAPGCLDGMSFKLGKLQIIFFIFTTGLWLFRKEKSKHINFIMIVFTVLSGLFLFLTLQISKIVWMYIPYSGFVQYPWRFLGPLGVCMALFSGYMLYGKKSLFSIFFFIFMGGGILFTNVKLFSPQYLYTQPVESFGDVEELRWRASKVSDEYLPKGIKIPETPSFVVKERVSGNEFIKVTRIRENETLGVYEIEAIDTRELRLNMAYFPGWSYSVNGVQVKPKVVEGEPYVVLSSGNNLLEMRFLDTNVRKIGNWISLATAFGIVIMMAYGKKAFSHHSYTCI